MITPSTWDAAWIDECLEIGEGGARRVNPYAMACPTCGHFEHGLPCDSTRCDCVSSFTTHQEGATA